MNKFVCYAIISLNFIFAFNSFAKESGYLWNPIAWTIALEEVNEENVKVEIKSVSLKFYEKSKDRIILKDMYTNIKKNSRVILNNKRRTQIYFAKKLSELDPGSYEFKSLYIKYSINDNEVLDYDISLSDLFKSKDNKNNFASIDIANNFISPLPEVSFETKLLIKDKKINTYMNYYDLVEDDFIEINDIYSEIIAMKNKKFASNIKFMYANSEFPPLQLDGTKIRHQNSINLGMLVDISCDITGVLKTVWVNKVDLLQYAFYQKLNYDKDNCKIHNTYRQNYYLPEGIWIMQSMTLRLKNSAEKNFKTTPLINRSKEIMKYFKITEEYFKIQNIKERTLLKLIELNINGSKDKSGMYFLGSTEIKREKNEDDVSFYFKRNYEVISLKKTFEVKKVYNAFSGEILKKDRIIGDIQLKVLLNGNKNNNKRLESQLFDIREFITTDVIQCVYEQEILDPLLVLNGSIKLNNLRENSRILDISLKDFDFSSSGFSQNKINECVLKKLKSFSFKKPFSTPFKAKIIFESY